MTLLELTAFWIAAFWAPLGIVAYWVATAPEEDSARTPLDGANAGRDTNRTPKEPI